MGAESFDDDIQPTRDAGSELLHSVQLTGATVRITAGPDQGQVTKVSPTGLVIGAGAGCDLRLHDPLVSRRHLELRPSRKGVHLRDLSSRNGTYIGGAKVSEALIKRDTVLSIGKNRLAISVERAGVQLAVSERTTFGRAIAHSDALRHVFVLLEKAARNNVTVLLEGASGTGKDVLAHSLHDESKRSEGPFVVFDCAATPEHLFESELFGNEKGAFTGAVSAREGALEQAHGGTLFLDEVGELPLEMQPKLLRALENRSFRRLGGKRTLEVDIRVVAATNRDLKDAVAEGEFREDLFYRLAVLHVAVPPLRDRREDILPIARMFLARISGDEDVTLPDELAQLLEDYQWPGNTRELRNVVERYAAFEEASAEVLFSHALKPKGGGGALELSTYQRLPYYEARQRLLHDFNQRILNDAVKAARGSVAKAAKALEMPRGSLYRMLQQLKSGVEPESE